MKKYFFIFFIFFGISYQLFSQSFSKIDLYNCQIIKYNFNEIMMEENACIDYGDLYIRVPYFTDFKDTLVMSKLNQYFHSNMTLQLNSLEFRKLLSKHAINAEIAYDQNSESVGNKKLMTCDFNQSLYVPNITQVYAYVGDLINDILTIGVTYVYSTTVKNNRRMTFLRYNILAFFNIKTGKIYSSNEVFVPNSISFFNTSINNAYKNNQFIIKNQELFNNNSYEYYDGYSPSVTSLEGESDNEGNLSSYDEGGSSYIEPPSPPRYENEEINEVEYIDNETESNTYNSTGYDYSKSFIMPTNVLNDLEFEPKKTIRELKEFNANFHGFYGFNGVNFYYIMPAFQPCHHLNNGESLVFDFSYDDVKKIINPNGPYGFLLKMNFEAKKNIFIAISNISQNNDLINTNWNNINQIEFKPDFKVRKINIYTPNINYNQEIYYGKTTQIDTNKYILKQTLTFDKGKLISKIEKERDTTQNTKWKYEYNEFGEIKLISKSNNGYVNYERHYFYDNNRFLIKEIEKENDQITKITHYLYKDNALLKFNLGYNLENNFTAYYYANPNKLDSMLTYTESSVNFNSFRYDSIGNHILTYGQNNLEYQYFLYENNRLMTIGSENSLIDFKYNQEGKLISKTNEEGWYEFIEYDNNGRIYKVINKNENDNNSDFYNEEIEEFYTVKFEYFE